MPSARSSLRIARAVVERSRSSVRQECSVATLRDGSALARAERVRAASLVFTRQPSARYRGPATLALTRSRDRCSSLSPLCG